MFVTGNVIRLSQFFSRIGDEQKNFLQSRIRWVVSLAGQSGFVALLKNPVFRFFDECRKVCADAVSDAKRQFQCRIAKPTLDKAQHGFGDARILRDGVIGKFPAFPLLSQELDNFVANGFVVADSRHDEAWQRSWLDTYFAIVKIRRLAKSGFVELKIKRKENI